LLTVRKWVRPAVVAMTVVTGVALAQAPALAATRDCTRRWLIAARADHSDGIGHDSTILRSDRLDR
jgi:hypothetical protein